MSDFNLVTALAQPAQPDSYFHALESLVDQTIGVRLFTLMEIDKKRGVARRCYSNQPEAYPVLGEKPLEVNDWTQWVEEKQQTFVRDCQR